MQSLEDVAYGVYVTAGHITIAFEKGRDVNDKALEKPLSNTTSYEDITFIVLGTYTRYPFLMLWNTNEDTAKLFLCLVMHV